MATTNFDPGKARRCNHNTFCIATFSYKSSGPDPRMMLYFRISPQDRPKKYLKAYPQGLYDIWNEWKGIKNIVNSLEKTKY